MKIGDTFKDGDKTYKCIGEASGYPVCQLVSKGEKVEEKTEAPKRRRKTVENV